MPSEVRYAASAHEAVALADPLQRDGLTNRTTGRRPLHATPTLNKPRSPADDRD